MKISTYLMIGLISYTISALLTGGLLVLFPSLTASSHALTGILTALSIAILGTIYSRQRAKKDPTYKRQVRIDTTDERLISIRHASGNTAWWVTLGMLCVYTLYLSIRTQKMESLITAAIALISIATYCIVLLKLNKDN